MFHLICKIGAAHGQRSGGRERGQLQRQHSSAHGSGDLRADEPRATDRDLLASDTRGRQDEPDQSTGQNSPGSGLGGAQGGAPSDLPQEELNPMIFGEIDLLAFLIFCTYAQRVKIKYEDSAGNALIR